MVRIRTENSFFSSVTPWDAHYNSTRHSGANATATRGIESVGGVRRVGMIRVYSVEAAANKKERRHCWLLHAVDILCELSSGSWLSTFTLFSFINVFLQETMEMERQQKSLEVVEARQSPSLARHVLRSSTSNGMRRSSLPLCLRVSRWFLLSPYLQFSTLTQSVPVSFVFSFSTRNSRFRGDEGNGFFLRNWSLEAACWFSVSTSFLSRCYGEKSRNHWIMSMKKFALEVVVFEWGEISLIGFLLLGEWKDWM